MALTQTELNEKLYDAVMTDNAGMAEVEGLLELGADPLGSYDSIDPGGTTVGDLFCEVSTDRGLSERMPELVRVFIDHGMDIGKRSFPSDDDVHPLWCLQFDGNENGVRMLKLLLDQVLDIESAEILVDHIFTDMEICSGSDIGDERFAIGTMWSLKMVMLTASYPRILEKSDFIRSCVEIENNDPQNAPKFRVWNDFDYHIDISTCTNVPHGLQNAMLTITEKKTSKRVWQI